MTTDARTSRLHCPECDYRLLGLPMTGQRVRCPECGASVHLHRLATMRTIEGRQQRRVDREIMLVLLIVVGMVLIGFLFGDRLGGDTFGGRLEFLIGPRAAPIAIAVAGYVFLLSFAVWVEARRSDRIAIAVVTTLIVLAVPLPWSLVLLPFWLARWAGA
jgi:DNA-directed RNA polymerase subunit RPC12/RpoP